MFKPNICEWLMAVPNICFKQ